MNILWDGPKLKTVPRGGVARYCADLITSVASMPHTRVLAACPKGAPAYPCQAPGLRQISLRELPALDRYRLRRFQPDIFHSSYYDPPLCPVRKVVQTVYNFIDVRLPAFYSNRDGFAQRQRAALESADAVIAISESTRDDLLRFTSVTEERARIVYPSIPAHFRQPMATPSERELFGQGLTGGAPYWLWVGPRHHYKNLGTFLEAFAATASNHGTHLVLVGGDQLRLNDLEQTCVIRHQLWDRIHIEAGVSDARLRLLYASAAALVQSALWEGFGLPLAEALACGTRLIVSDISVFREVAGEHAHYAPPTDPDAWTHALETCLHASESELDRQTRKAFVEKRFDPAEAARTLHTLYRELI